MYLEFFNLREFPFSIACDEKYFFESEIHTEALSNMLYAVSQRKGMVLISGQVGAGKTFLGSMLASRLGLSALIVAIRHPPASAKQLLRAMGAGLGLKLSPEMDLMAVADEVRQALEQRHRRGQLVAMLIDEIQDLPDDALEEVRLIWNWELDGQRLAQIILVGQPEIRQRLLQPRWESLRQRIVLSYHLGRLTPTETEQYVHHRIAVAAESNGEADPSADEALPKFLPDALAEIHKATRGTPRLINSVCDNALLTAYARSRREIDTDIIRSVLQNMTFWAVEPEQDEQPPDKQAKGDTASAGDTAKDATPTRTENTDDAPPRQDNPQPEPAAGPTPDDPPTDAATAQPSADAGNCDGVSPPPATTNDTTDNVDQAKQLHQALLDEPTADMARQVYSSAPAGSEAQHLAIRMLAQGVLQAIREDR